ncbi:hypothetical protein [Natrinema hispanicum]|nr:hypothetical protein [Natrinema hispanicum]
MLLKRVRHSLERWSDADRVVVGFQLVPAGYEIPLERRLLSGLH